jgi:cytidylate kinase
MARGATFRIAVDGPSGAGKSTIAKRLAADFGIDYIDTGAMYRAIALKLLAAGIDACTEAEALAALLEDTSVDFTDGHILLDGKDVTDRIRTPEVTAEASRSSAVPAIREKLVALQRDMGASKSVVMDGRDIGTNVFPTAEHKFFLTASPQERARRRLLELSGAGSGGSFESVLAAIEKRDYDDAHRALNPLRQAEDAIVIDSDGLTVDEVAEKIKSYICT